MSSYDSVKPTKSTLYFSLVMLISFDCLITIRDAVFLSFFVMSEVKRFIKLVASNLVSSCQLTELLAVMR